MDSPSARSAPSFDPLLGSGELASEQGSQTVSNQPLVTNCAIHSSTIQNENPSLRLWAYSLEDAEARVEAIRGSLTCLGQLYTVVS